MNDVCKIVTILNEIIDYAICHSAHSILLGLNNVLLLQVVIGLVGMCLLVLKKSILNVLVCGCVPTHSSNLVNRRRRSTSLHPFSFDSLARMLCFNASLRIAFTSALCSSNRNASVYYSKNGMWTILLLYVYTYHVSKCHSKRSYVFFHNPSVLYIIWSLLIKFAWNLQFLNYMDERSTALPIFCILFNLNISCECASVFVCRLFVLNRTLSRRVSHFNYSQLLFISK